MRQTSYVSFFSHSLCALHLSISFFIEMNIMLLPTFNNILRTSTSSSWHRRYSLHELLDNQSQVTLSTTKSYPVSVVIFTSCASDTGNVTSIYKIFEIFLFQLKSCSEFSLIQLWGPLPYCLLSKITYMFVFSKSSLENFKRKKKKMLIASVTFRRLHSPHILDLQRKKP